jgi:SAM-dependent methyltransferase
MKHGQAAEYENSAGYYDLVVGDRTPHVNFYSSLIVPGQTSLVDLACGTGVITAAMARAMRQKTPGARHRICGIDGSQRMLDIARRSEQGVEWIVSDIRHPPPMEPFELAVCCFHTLQAFDRDDLALVLRTARSLLCAGGRFAFDIYRPDWSAIRRQPAVRTVRAFQDAHGRRLDIQEHSSLDTTNSIYSLRWTLRDLDVSPPKASARFHFRFWQHEPAVVEALLREAGFAVIERYGDLDRRVWNDTQKRQVLVCTAR